MAKVITKSSQLDFLALDFCTEFLSISNPPEGGIFLYGGSLAVRNYLIGKMSEYLREQGVSVSEGKGEGYCIDVGHFTNNLLVNSSRQQVSG